MEKTKAVDTKTVIKKLVKTIEQARNLRNDVLNNHYGNLMDESKALLGELGTTLEECSLKVLHILKAEGMKIK